MLAAVGDSTDVRDRAAGLVHPNTGHLDELGTPTWFGPGPPGLVDALVGVWSAPITPV